MALKSCFALVLSLVLTVLRAEETAPPPGNITKKLKIGNITGVGNITKKRQIVYVGAKWCGPCISQVTDHFEPMAKVGWGISNKPDAKHIRVYDYDTQAKELPVGNITTIPVFVLMVDGVEKKRITGLLSSSQIKALWAD